MVPRLLYYSDVENAYDDPDRIGRLAGTIDALGDDRTILAGTGDNTAPGVLALYADGRQALDFFRAVEPDLETFGNHDFDFGTEPLREIVAESPQRWLSANVYEDGEGGPGSNEVEGPGSPSRQFAGVDGTAVIERGGERVGFVGVTASETAEITVGTDGLAFTDPVAEVEAALPTLRDRADHVVVLAHLRPEVEHAIAAFDGVDAIVGGHVHAERCERVDGTLLLRPGPNGRVLWEVDFRGEPTATRHAVPEGPLDDAVADDLRSRMADTGLTDVVCVAGEPIVRERDRRIGGECRLANLVTDAYRWATGAEVGFVQTGGLRDGPALAGEVTVADLVGVTPFDNDLYTVRLSGTELEDLVASAFVPDPDRATTWAGHFSGIRIRYDEAAGRVREVRQGGDPLDPDAEYSVATNEYVVYQKVDPLAFDDVVETWGVQYETVVEYAREEGLDVELDGRLSAVGD